MVYNNRVKQTLKEAMGFRSQKDGKESARK